MHVRARQDGDSAAANDDDDGRTWGRSCVWWFMLAVERGHDYASDRMDGLDWFMRWCWTGSSRSRPASINKNEERGKSGVATGDSRWGGVLGERPGTCQPPTCHRLQRYRARYSLSCQGVKVITAWRFISVHPWIVWIDGCAMDHVAM